MPKNSHEVWSFSEMARHAACAVGSPTAFAVACAAILVWALSGPIFGYSDTWQLVINTGTTIVTFLMVFLVQNTQNRDARALHLKLDELIRSVQDARNKLIDLENCSDEEIERIENQFRALKKREERNRAKQPARSP
jgi:low affinity Fe/Cu permease